MCFVDYLLEGLRAKMARSFQTVALFNLFQWLPIEGPFSEDEFYR